MLQSLNPNAKKRKRKPGNRWTSSSPELTPTEKKVVRKIAEGKQNKTIAFEMGLKEATVKLHVMHASKRLNARNRTQLCVLAGALKKNEEF